MGLAAESRPTSSGTGWPAPWPGARIQAGALGPAVEDQFRPHGLTLRHATNQTHIDDFGESVRMLTPAGWWEFRRLPGNRDE